jgi:hypothetical protein
MAGPITATFSEGNSGQKRSADVVRLVRATLATTMLGERVQMDFYARNGFRFLSVPAWLDPDALAVRCQQFRNLARLDLARARQQSIRTIDDEHLDSETILAAVAKLESPRHRFFSELFWPHVAEADFASIRKATYLGSETLISVFGTQGKTTLARLHNLHARALNYHCFSIQTELEFVDKRMSAPGGHWEKAVAAWREVYGLEEFWAYMNGRVVKLDDPRLKKEDVEKARRELPRLILGIQELFAERYAETGEFPDCLRHLNLIRNSGFPAEIVREATLSAVKRVAGKKLEDLNRRTKQIFAGITKVNRREFEAAAGPLLQEAQGIRDLLVERLQLPDELLEQSAFDDFAEAVKQATASNILYEGAERERNILYSSLFVKRLLVLPLSPLVRRNMEQTIQNDSRILYSTFGMDSGYPQAVECFFLKGAEADPEDSIVIPMHRITQRNVKIDRAKGSAGISVAFDRGKMLIPRSKQAKTAHGSVVQVQVAPSDYTQAQRSVAAELKALESSYLASRADMNRERDAKVRAANEQQAGEQERRARDFSKRVEKANASVARLTAEEQEAIAVEQRALESGKLTVQAKHDSALRAARNERDRKLRGTAGIAGVLKVELPTAALIILALSLKFGFGINPMIAALICAAIVGRGTRVALARIAGGPLREAEGSVARDLSAYHQESERKANDIRADFASKRQQCQVALDSALKEKSEYAEVCAQRLAAIRKRWDDKIESSTHEYEQRARSLRSQLVRSQTVLKQAQQTEFPALKFARAKGYRDGEEPSASDMQFTQAERTQATIMLGRLG